MLQNSIWNYAAFLLLIIFLLKANKLRPQFLTIFFFAIGFLFALLTSFSLEVKANIDIVKFIIPLLIFLLAVVFFIKRKTVSKNLTWQSLLIFLFAFFNGLGVFVDVDNQIGMGIGYFLPTILTVLGASIAVFGLILVGYLIKIIISQIKKIQPVTIGYVASLTCCIFALVMMFKEVFI